MDLEKAADDLANRLDKADAAKNDYRDTILGMLRNAFIDGRNASAQETRTASTTGWICPVCGRGVNPAFPSCQCVKAKEATP